MLSLSIGFTTCLCHPTVGRTYNWTPNPSQSSMLSQGTHTNFAYQPNMLSCESTVHSCCNLTDCFRHLQLLENEKILLIVDDQSGNILVYLDSQQTIGHAVSRAPRKNLHQSKIGKACIFAFDEARRMLAICETTKVELDFSKVLASLNPIMHLASVAHLCI